MVWILALALLAPAGPASAQTRPPPPPAAKPADPAMDATRAAFEALPEPERKALQDALVWTGDFNGVVSGGFGRRTFEALQAFAARARLADPLTAEGRTALRAAGEAARKAARFRVQADPVSGAVVGVPEALLAKRTALPSGTRWQSADGKVTFETRAYPPEAETLEGLFERANAPLNGRKVTYRLQKPDFVVVTAETATGLSYTRYAAGPQGIRGFLIGYDRALAGEVGRLVIAMANAFEPFPAAAPVAATPAPSPAPAVAPARLVATGLAVAPGRVLAVVPEGCAGTLARDPSGLALVEVAGAKPAALALAESLADGPVVALAAGAEGVAAVPGTVMEGRVTAPLQPGSAGAPLFGAQGRLAGLVAAYPAAPRLVAGVAPPTSLPVVTAAAIAAFLAGKGIALSGAREAGPAGAAPAIVGLTCR
ncbi:serine protease [Methylobacterium sp. J-067]|uniref:serine protease n=1 Tax=Methylobacterium sp. J-067 TaxID=2836648 RepID=UPI001FBBBB9E|nr:serine protease [Methylobacterium sp. J-067]MCJ2022879.1 serine protease [Methylobacterium sp. J-067]